MPYPEGNRFAVATEDDARAWPWVSGLLSLILSTAVLAARFATKRKALRGSDWCLVPSYVAALAYWSLSFYGLLHGLATTTSGSDEGEVKTLALHYRVSQAPLLFSVGVTRWSIAVLIYEVTDIGGRGWRPIAGLGWRQNVRLGWQQIAALASFCLAGLWALCAPLVATLRCHSPQRRERWTCSDGETRLLTIAAIDVSVELLLVALLCTIIWKLQTRRNIKAKAILGASCRLLVTGPVVGRCLAHRELLEQGRPSTDPAAAIVWDQGLLFAAIITATVPVLLSKVKELGSVHLLTTNHSRSGGRSDYELSELDIEAVGGRKANESVAGGDGTDIARKGIVEAEEAKSSCATISDHGRRSSYGSEVRILEMS